MAGMRNGSTRRKFLARLQGEITKRGTIDVLRHGLKHGPHHLDLFYGTPSPGNVKAQERYAANRFSVTRQFRYSRDETQRALDVGLLINGLPVATFETRAAAPTAGIDSRRSREVPGFTRQRHSPPRWNRDTERTFRRVLKALVAEDQVIGVGETRWRKYHLNPALGHKRDNGQ